MKKYIHLQYSNNLPGRPTQRSIENIALADRRALGCRFGEPCDPRRLIKFHDVNQILETREDYEAHCRRPFHEDFEKRWSGVTMYIKDGEYLIMVNPEHSIARRTFTIAHEFGHLVLGHTPIIVSNEGIPHPRYSDEQEFGAHSYGLAVLLPYAPLLQIVRQGASARGIAHHYGVSKEAVEMRLKITGLWKLLEQKQ